MEPTTPAAVAAMVTWFGVLGLIVAGLAVIALRLVRAEDVPACARGRIRWWTAHHTGFLMASLVVTLAGICVLGAVNLGS